MDEKELRLLSFFIVVYLDVKLLACRCRKWVSVFAKDLAGYIGNPWRLDQVQAHCAVLTRPRKATQVRVLSPPPFQFKDLPLLFGFQKRPGIYWFNFHEIGWRPMCSIDSAILHLPNKNFVDPLTIHIHDFEAQAVPLKMIGRAWHATQVVENEAGECLIVPFSFARQ